MELAPRYCRSCGSRILVKNVCHNCNNDPLKGDNYCYDCGALTPNADSCLNCGAKYKSNFPVKPVLIIGSLLIVTMAVAAFFISRSGKQPLASQQEKTITPTPTPETREVPQIQNTIVNNPVDTSVLIAIKPKDTTVSKPKPKDSVKTKSDIFTSEELKA